MRRGGADFKRSELLFEECGKSIAGEAVDGRPWRRRFSSTGDRRGVTCWIDSETVNVGGLVSILRINLIGKAIEVLRDKIDLVRRE